MNNQAPFVDFRQNATYGCYNAFGEFIATYLTRNHLSIQVEPVHETRFKTVFSRPGKFTESVWGYMGNVETYDLELPNDQLIKAERIVESNGNRLAITYHLSHLWAAIRAIPKERIKWIDLLEGKTQANDTVFKMEWRPDSNTPYQQAFVIFRFGAFTWLRETSTEEEVPVKAKSLLSQHIDYAAFLEKHLASIEGMLRRQPTIIKARSYK